ncbi:MAG: SRPBCC family protein [Vicinamibacterales bacterium]
MATAADCIRKTVVLDAPVERVWRAIGDSAQFGAWFGARFDGSFVEGRDLEARIVPTTVDPVVAKLQEPHAGTRFVVHVVRVEPERLLSFRWHPFGAHEPGDPAPPSTLVEFVLEAVSGGTRLTVTESGFEGIPLERRAAAFEANDQGWAHQMRLITTYVATTA